MENLDIDKLERKNVYKVPENFFAEMQQKVLAETAPKKEAKIFKLNWAYSVAAAVTLLFGITFFVTQNDNTTNVNNTQNLVANNNQQKSNTIKDQQKAEAAIAYQTFEEDLTSVVQNNQKEEQGSVAVVSENKNNNVAKKKETTSTPEVQVDQILSNFTSTELAAIAKNSEKDIYLDLYN